MIKEYLELGLITGTHGVRGEMRVNPLCDSFEFFKKFRTVYFDENGKEEIKVLSSREHGTVYLISLDKIDTVEKAQALRGKTLYIKRSDARLPQGRFFIAELIGCKVLDADNEELEYGVISDVSKTGANDVWHIIKDGAEYLIPAVPAVVIETDVKNNFVKIRPIKGMFSL